MEWIWDSTNRVYFNPHSSTYAIPDKDGWKYVESVHMMEEGEIEDDVGWGGLMEPASQLVKVQHILRLVVERSSFLEGVAVIDDRDGGVQVGRDRCEHGGVARIRLKEMQVSKTHAVVYWGDGGEGQDDWYIVDLGSTHGTVVDGNRLSDAKQSSKPFRLAHLSRISIGTTTFVAHIHPSWPCDECQLGRGEVRLDDGRRELKSVPKPITTKREDRAMRTRAEMQSLKQRLLAGGEEIEGDGRVYMDRSAMRRTLHRRARSASPEKAPTAPQITQSFGSNLLAAQGWTPGSGLGKDGLGRVDPIQVGMRGREGLGTQVEEDWRQRGKQRRYEDYAR